MARHEVPAEAIAQPERPFKVDPVACAFLPQRCALQALGRYIDREASRLNVRYRQACPIYGYAVAKAYFSHWQTAVDKKLSAAAAGADFAYLANSFNNASKHVYNFYEFEGLL
jgi:hypothetical protein